MPARPEDLWWADELDELLAGPRGGTRLGQVLAAAGAPAEAGHQPGEEAALRAFRETFPVSRPASKPRVLVARVSGRAAAAALAGGLVLSGGAAAAAAGALPGAAQQTAKAVLAKVGVSVPGPHGHADGHPGRRGKSTVAPLTPVEPSATARASERPGTVNEVSGVARSTASTGVDKGAAVSGTASDGKSQAGRHGSTTSPPAGKKTPTPAASTHRYGSTHKPTKAGAGRTTAPTGGSHTSGSVGGRR